MQSCLTALHQTFSPKSTVAGLVGSVATMYDNPGPGKISAMQGLSMGSIALGICLLGTIRKPF